MSWEQSPSLWFQVVVRLRCRHCQEEFMIADSRSHRSHAKLRQRKPSCQLEEAAVEELTSSVKSLVGDVHSSHLISKAALETDVARLRAREEATTGADPHIAKAMEAADIAERLANSLSVARTCGQANKEDEAAAAALPAPEGNEDSQVVLYEVDDVRKQVAAVWRAIAELSDMVASGAVGQGEPAKPAGQGDTEPPASPAGAAALQAAILAVMPESTEHSTPRASDSNAIVDGYPVVKALVDTVSDLKKGYESLSGRDQTRAKEIVELSKQVDSCADSIARLRSSGVDDSSARGRGVFGSTANGEGFVKMGSSAPLSRSQGSMVPPSPTVPTLRLHELQQEGTHALRAGLYATGSTADALASFRTASPDTAHEEPLLSSGRLHDLWEGQSLSFDKNLRPMQQQVAPPPPPPVTEVDLYSLAALTADYRGLG
eukprot:TRINITY_DN1893_c0_g1_i2.p1 TRINITY_DN1893_c0_g1~~TRINITY_DN1893_c0_g1_i2.p1  ORF type:complete len:432 (-),score=93.03 TRINITY_DN1893_c0_g1_i2:427-1722(-)